MTGYTTFEGRLEPMVWGKSTYTILRLTPEMYGALGDGTKWVEGEFNEHPVNLAITRAPVLDDPFLWTGKSLCDRAGLAPGVPFEAGLRAFEPSIVEVPPDVTRALRSAGVAKAWDTLTPGKQRGLIHGVETAKRAETRANRISKLIADLS